MKYFKYRNISKVQQLAYKERLASLGKDEQKKIKRSDRLTKLFMILIYIFQQNLNGQQKKNLLVIFTMIYLTG